MPHHANDGSNHPPAMEIHQSLWGMIGLPYGGPEWSLEEQLAQIAEAGFTGVLGRLPEPHEEDRWHRLLDRYNLKLGIHSFPRQVSDLVPLAKRATEFGVLYINSQVQDSFVVDEAALDLLRGLYEVCADAGVPYFVETHRGRITQDLLRTVGYVKALPQMRLTIDLSHYIVAGEIGVPHEAVEQAFDILLDRTACIHARVSNGEQVQVDIGQGEQGPILHYLRWWEKGMREWRNRAAPGDILPFVVELGPPAYSITLPDGTGTEISDRWQQALVFKRLAAKLWANIVAEDRR